ncbi:UNVERIFIED_CONTAM: hypothetical protein PYX00_004226 [Menopon gallinae]|uniref:Uncharacterized protein n=1 Tax=Menopon gallinae TaxID=328185 RepID=A0AAW2I3F5_9NEOP
MSHTYQTRQTPRFSEANDFEWESFQRKFGETKIDNVEHFVQSCRSYQNIISRESYCEKFELSGLNKQSLKAHIGKACIAKPQGKATNENGYVSYTRTEQEKIDKIVSNVMNYSHCKDAYCEVIYLLAFFYQTKQCLMIPVVSVTLPHTRKYISKYGTEYSSLGLLIEAWDLPHAMVCVPKNGTYDGKSVLGGPSLEFLVFNSHKSDEYSNLTNQRWYSAIGGILIGASALFFGPAAIFCAVGYYVTHNIAISLLQNNLTVPWGEHPRSQNVRRTVSEACRKVKEMCGENDKHDSTVRKPDPILFQQKPNVSDVEELLNNKLNVAEDFLKRHKRKTDKKLMISNFIGTLSSKDDDQRTFATFLTKLNAYNEGDGLVKALEEVPVDHIIRTDEKVKVTSLYLKSPMEDLCKFLQKICKDEKLKVVECNRKIEIETDKRKILLVPLVENFVKYSFVWEAFRDDGINWGKYIKTNSLHFFSRQEDPEKEKEKPFQDQAKF